MKFSNFLKPDKFKVIILLIFFAIEIVAFRIYELDPVETNPVMNLLIPLNYPGMVLTYYLYNVQPYFKFLGTPINVVYWYLLACVIVLVARKFFEKKPASPSA
jgi:hypothetical protein